MGRSEERFGQCWFHQNTDSTLLRWIAIEVGAGLFSRNFLKTILATAPCAVCNRSSTIVNWFRKSWKQFPALLVLCAHGFVLLSPTHVSIALFSRRRNAIRKRCSNWTTNNIYSNNHRANWWTFKLESKPYVWIMKWRWKRKIPCNTVLNRRRCFSIARRNYWTV